MGNGRDDIISKYAYELMNHGKLVELAEKILKYSQNISESQFYCKLLKDAVGVEIKYKPSMPRRRRSCKKGGLAEFLRLHPPNKL